MLLVCFEEAMGPHQADIDALSHLDPYIRAAAAERLGEARCTEALDVLVATMNWRQDDAEDEIEGRIAAVAALGMLGDQRAIPSLMRLTRRLLSSPQIVFRNPVLTMRIENRSMRVAVY